MNEPDFTGNALDLSQAHVAILGLGLMGGSLALALRGRCRAILGYDPDRESRALAEKRGAVDRAPADPADCLSIADLVVLAAPVRAILHWIANLPAFLPGNAYVLDLGSTKWEICRAMEALPPRIVPLGGHPLCGKETAGIANADGELFKGAPFVLTRLRNSTENICSLATQLVQAIGAHAVWLDAATHDRWTAATSHVPYLMASLLAASTPVEMSALVGSGFRSTARLAASSPPVMMDILTSNRENILETLRNLRNQAEVLETLLSRADDSALSEWLLRARARHRELIS